ncbi:hypothetical protein B0A54_06898 [Friedmanniomyces endolithicus]|uniref:Mitochondrial nicotinamide adenine dinucleotide transporter 1 n=1 Tax=Friedmanniomyces endolithicus TaxID=329885 RepID=A0A4U0V1I5_9PEZI|nr:hypothetical protein B0A54_06898 [Friedmanniomyces endolithicus]
MQNMAEGDGDTHDHSPPNTFAKDTKQVLVRHTPFPALAIWTTGLSNTSIASFSGAIAGAASGVVTCPLDVIKTKLQAGNSFHIGGAHRPGPPASQLYYGLIGTTRTILKDDGIRGMYRGLAPMLIGYLPTWAVYMAVYNSSREYFYDNGWNMRERDKVLAQMMSAVTAGACSTLTTNPIWVIKTRFMSQMSPSRSDGVRTPWHYTSTLDAARKMYRAEGLAVFYSGLGPALLGLTHVAIQFPLYEYFKQRFTGLEMGESAPKSSGATDGRTTLGILAATFLSKTSATMATYPHEVLRTRMQTQTRHIHPESDHHGQHSQAVQRGGNKVIGNTDGAPYQPKYRGVINTCKIILREEGWRAFYNGMGTNLIRAVPAAMTTMLTFESVKGAVGRLQAEGRELVVERARG